MLVLGRKIGQKILLGDDIEITILEVRGEHVRLGIDAPRDVPVYRKEMLEQIAEENSEAAGAAAVTVGKSGRLAKLLQPA
jgi:carbon storage regulator